MISINNEWIYPDVLLRKEELVVSASFNGEEYEFTTMNVNSGSVARVTKTIDELPKFVLLLVGNGFIINSISKEAEFHMYGDLVGAK